jgi:hypothetical protein
MVSERDCLQFARQCERLAGLCEDDAQLREHLIDLAREWISQAMHERGAPRDVIKPTVSMS